MPVRPLCLLAAAVLATLPARAEIVASAPDGLHARHTVTLPVTPEESFARLTAIGSWWSDAHTWTGSAANMRLTPEAGGLWRETAGTLDVTHGTVVFADPPRTLRLSALLGPLQEMGLSGALTFALTDGTEPGTTTVTVDYRVSGSSLSGLDRIAPVVDRVLGEQMASLAAVPPLGVP